MDPFVSPRPPLPGGSSSDPLIGESLGGWRISRKLGEEGTGPYYEASSSGGTAALHVLKYLDPKVMDALDRSIRAASAVDHPRVAWIRPIQRSGRDTWFVRELTDYRSLRNVIRSERPVDTSRLLRLLVDAADGLAAIHARGLIHRELTPETFEFDSEGRIKVTGLGRTVHVDLPHLTPIMPNPRYMPPEIAEGRHAVAASDLYALGLVAWELATGTIPHEADSVMETLKHRLLSPLPKLGATLPPGIAALIERMLQRKPEDRYRDGGVLSQVLRIEADAAPDRTPVVKPPIVY